jgi:drug/metabolite transporter (DMT)-like permease
MTEMAKKRNPLVYLGVLVAVNLMWAFQFSGAKIATERLGPVTVTLLPMLLATVLLIPVVAFSPGRHTNLWRAPGAARDMLLLSLLGVTPAQLCLTWGIKHSLASNAAVITLTTPVLTTMLAVAFLGERMTLMRWISFVMASVGVVLTSDIDWRSIDFVHAGYLGGNALIFASCMGSAFYNSFSKRVLERFSPIEVLFYTFAACDAVLLVLMLWLEPPSLATLAGLGAATWFSLVAIAIFSLAVSMGLYFWVIQFIDVTQASLSVYLLPVFGVILSAIALHERLTVQLLAGGGMVFLGTFLVTTYEEQRKRRAAVTATRVDAMSKEVEIL